MEKGIGAQNHKSQEPRAKSQEPRAKSKSKSQEPRAKSQEPRAKSQEPRAKSQEDTAQLRQDIASHSHHGHLRAVLVFAASFLLLTGGNAYAQGSVATDRAALVALYNATDGANWTNNTNWLSTEALSEWYGIRTDASDRVVQLSSHPE